VLDFTKLTSSSYSTTNFGAPSNPAIRGLTADLFINGVRGRITPEVVRDLDDRGGGRVHQSSPFRVDPESLGLALAYSASASQLQPSHRALA